MAKRNFDPHIHGLRGLATLAIVVHHIYIGAFRAGFYPEHWPTALLWVLESFRYSLEIFFLISGYLITETLRHSAGVRAFALDRAIRIYPAFIAAMTPVFILGALTQSLPLFQSEPAWSWFLHYLSNLLFLPGMFDVPIVLGVAWTLSIEAAFYITAACAFAAVRRNRRVLAWLIPIVPLLWTLARYPGAGFLVVGVLCSLYRGPLTRALRPVRWPSLWLPVFIGVWTAYMARHFFGHQPLDALGGILIVVALAASLAFFSTVTSGDGGRVLGPLLRHRGIQFCGSISYSLYLWHTPVLFIAKRLSLHYVVPGYGDVAGVLVFAALSIPPSLLAAYLSYEFFERRMGRWLHQRYGQPKPAAAAGLVAPPDQRGV